MVNVIKFFECFFDKCLARQETNMPYVNRDRIFQNKLCWKKFEGPINQELD